MCTCQAFLVLALFYWGVLVAVLVSCHLLWRLSGPPLPATHMHTYGRNHCHLLAPCLHWSACCRRCYYWLCLKVVHNMQRCTTPLHTGFTPQGGGGGVALSASLKGCSPSTPPRTNESSTGLEKEIALPPWLTCRFRHHKHQAHTPRNRHREGYQQRPLAMRRFGRGGCQENRDITHNVAPPDTHST